MTIKHIIEGVMQVTGARNYHKCAIRLGLHTSSITRIMSGEQASMGLEAIDQIQHATDIPFDTIFKWYRMPADARLGRVIRIR